MVTTTTAEKKRHVRALAAAGSWSTIEATYGRKMVQRAMEYAVKKRPTKSPMAKHGPSPQRTRPATIPTREMLIQQEMEACAALFGDFEEDDVQALPNFQLLPMAVAPVVIPPTPPPTTKAKQKQRSMVAFFATELAPARATPFSRRSYELSAPLASQPMAPATIAQQGPGPAPNHDILRDIKARWLEAKLNAKLFDDIACVVAYR
ncbi:hypothetical protein SPRG_07558 [Saprolegnia parasitica CBS 223.65]|uniref:Uncharacterized protein n=1 Tax=Saprolegnia parasitica (strain CBS 223.65) TaxID=695850 RepID=A0A067C968_SAPPC|nr:hypothetical protein SPRG_07558 [Saprolegnia parasitica CBS 223.65]KDO27309.1 hypothetical protein SPRG_07558 [Saprolegnia parasitica CBS 223.65]|eukprot:XP_012202082.1 hypothetical protein SPRG_07558 [Saprolegnia parasitica CBS 223.65]